MSAFAVVLIPIYKEAGDFRETCCNNRGFGYMAFTFMEDAGACMARLKQKQQSADEKHAISCRSFAAAANERSAQTDSKRKTEFQ